MLRHIWLWLLTFYARVNGFLEAVLGDLGLPDDEEIKRLMGGREKHKPRAPVPDDAHHALRVSLEVAVVGVLVCLAALVWFVVVTLLVGGA